MSRAPDRRKVIQCVLFDAMVMARAAAEMQRLGRKDWVLRGTYMTAALIKLRSIRQFLFASPQKDDLTLRDLVDPKEPRFGIPLESINKYVAHITRARLKKTVKQPKCLRGAKKVISDAGTLLEIVLRVVDEVKNREQWRSLTRRGGQYYRECRKLATELARKKKT